MNANKGKCEVSIELGRVCAFLDYKGFITGDIFCHALYCVMRSYVTDMNATRLLYASVQVVLRILLLVERIFLCEMKKLD